MFVALFAGLLCYYAVQAARYIHNHPYVPAPGEEELKQAELLITTRRDGLTHGNSSAARSMAARLAEKMQTIRRVGFTGGDPHALDVLLTTDGRFAVYCQLHGDTCVFLIHVPEMHRYDSAAKASLAKLAYLAATRVLDENGPPGIHRLIVANHGVFLYDRVGAGDYVAHAENPLDSLRELSAGGMFVPALNPYFAPEQSTPLAPAGRAEQPGQ